MNYVRYVSAEPAVRRQSLSPLTSTTVYLYKVPSGVPGGDWFPRPPTNWGWGSKPAAPLGVLLFC